MTFCPKLSIHRLLSYFSLIILRGVFQIFTVKLRQVRLFLIIIFFNINKHMASCFLKDGFNWIMRSRLFCPEPKDEIKSQTLHRIYDSNWLKSSEGYKYLIGSKCFFKKTPRIKNASAFFHFFPSNAQPHLSHTVLSY